LGVEFDGGLVSYGFTCCPVQVGGRRWAGACWIKSEIARSLGVSSCDVDYDCGSIRGYSTKAGDLDGFWLVWLEAMAIALSVLAAQVRGVV
jgi:hypothetical protein